VSERVSGKRHIIMIRNPESEHTTSLSSVHYTKAAMKEAFPYEVLEGIFILLMHVDYMNVYFRALCDKSIMEMITQWTHITISIAIVCFKYAIDFSLFKRVTSLKIINENMDTVFKGIRGESVLSAILFRKLNTARITTLHLVNIDSGAVLGYGDISKNFQSLTVLVIENSFFFDLSTFQNLKVLCVDFADMPFYQIEAFMRYDSMNEIEHVELYSTPFTIVNKRLYSNKRGKVMRTIIFYKYTMDTLPSRQDKAVLCINPGEEKDIWPSVLFTIDEIKGHALMGLSYQIPTSGTRRYNLNRGS
jgi:hypothetical protein